MKLNFYSLGSGSSGNSLYLGNEFHGILIDAGISCGFIRKSLKKIGISFNNILGVFITHNHFDHIKGLEVLTRKNSIPAFTTENIWKSILSPPISHTINRDCVRKIPLLQKFHLAGFDIEAFPVSHDAPETVGYHINFEGKKFTIVTDLGHICQTAAGYIKKANILVIESNYDEYMLQTGHYPFFLKKRIQSDNGHLGNHQTAAFLAEVFHDRLTHICLAHLSKNNNTPEKALHSLNQALNEKGIVLNGRQKIVILNRSVPTEIIRLEDKESVLF